MRKSLVALAVLSSFAGWSASSIAADLPPIVVPPPPPPPPAPPPVAPAFSWQGCYIGAFGGYGWGVFTSESSGGVFHQFNDYTDPLDEADGPFAGGEVGCDFQRDRFVFGINANYAWANLTDTFDDGFNDALFTATLNAFGTLEARAGVALNNVLLYATGGLAHGRATITVTDRVVGETDTISNYHFGWTLGVGAEIGFSSALSIFAQYNYVSLLPQTYDFAAVNCCFATESVSFAAHLAKLGLRFRF